MFWRKFFLTSRVYVCYVLSCIFFYFYRLFFSFSFSTFFFYVVLYFAHVCGTRVYWSNIPLLVHPVLFCFIYRCFFSFSLYFLFYKTIPLLLLIYFFGSSFTHSPLWKIVPSGLVWVPWPCFVSLFHSPTYTRPLAPVNVP